MKKRKSPKFWIPREKHCRPFECFLPVFFSLYSHIYITLDFITEHYPRSLFPTLFQILMFLMCQKHFMVRTCHHSLHYPLLLDTRFVSSYHLCKLKKRNSPQSLFSAQLCLLDQFQHSLNLSWNSEVDRDLHYYLI